MNSENKKDIGIPVVNDGIDEITRYIENMIHNQHVDLIGDMQEEKSLSFIKKLINRCLQQYVEPKIQQQEKYNSAVTPAFGKIREILDIFNNKFSEIKEEMTNLLEEKELKVRAFEETQLMQSNLIKQMELEQEKVKSELMVLKDQNKLYSDAINLANERLNELKDRGIFSYDATNFFVKTTYSQSGEDSILAYIVKMLGIPFKEVDYVDLGANHAKEMSNTYFFYSMGAKGILVEANPNLIPELMFYRNRDIILNNCIDVESNKNIDFYILSGDGLSTPDYEEALLVLEKNPSLEIVDKKSIETISYNDIVNRYLGKPPVILSIDVEGNDYEILKSIDFENYRPTIVVVEMISYDINLAYTTKRVKLLEYMRSKEYDEYAFTGINSIFIDRSKLG